MFSRWPLPTGLELRATTLLRTAINGQPSSPLSCFWRANGWVLPVDVEEEVRIFLALAAGELSEDALAAWLKDRAVQRS